MCNSQAVFPTLPALSHRPFPTFPAGSGPCVLRQELFGLTLVVYYGAHFTSTSSSCLFTSFLYIIPSLPFFLFDPFLPFQLDSGWTQFIFTSFYPRLLSVLLLYYCCCSCKNAEEEKSTYMHMQATGDCSTAPCMIQAVNHFPVWAPAPDFSAFLQCCPKPLHKEVFCLFLCVIDITICRIRPHRWYAVRSHFSLSPYLRCLTLSPYFLCSVPQNAIWPFPLSFAVLG